MPKHIRVAALLLAALALPFALVPAVAQADEDDTRRLLNQMERGAAERERSQLVEEAPAGVDPASLITIGGTTYSVDNTLADLGPAIYVAINLRQWDKLRQFVDKYRRLPGHEVPLVLMAEGMLAREARDHRLAAARLRQALAAQPDFLRAKLELARVLFEDNQSAEATQLFAQISTAGIPDPVRPVIEGFQNALALRDAWHGSLSLGLGYNSNINQANGREDRLEVCYFFGCYSTTRKMPDPIASASLVYDLTLERRLQLAGHHHLLLRGIGYGRRYDKHQQGNPDVHYDEDTAILYAGYNYLDAQDDLALTPLFEHYRSDRQAKYQAAGLRLDWKRRLDERWQLGANAQRKRLRFQADARRYFDDYAESQYGVHASYMVDSATALYGGLGYTRRMQPEATARSRERMANLGVYRGFEAGVTLNATALYRHIRNDEADQFLGGRREDHQRILILNLGLPRLAFQGIVPNLYLKHTINDSNIAWAYRYRQTEAALKFEKRF